MNKKKSAKPVAVVPRDEDFSRAKISYLIGRLNRHVLLKTIRAVSVFGLTPAQFTALAVLKTFGPLSNAELSRRSFVAPQSMHELINGMEHGHLTYRRSLPGGGRAVQIGLTAAGEAMVTKCEQRTAAIEKEMLSALNATQRTGLQNVLAVCVRSIEGRQKRRGDQR